jgi:hypothetical protein
MEWHWGDVDPSAGFANALGRRHTDLPADPADRSAVFLDGRFPNARDPEQIVRRGVRLPAAAAKA